MALACRAGAQNVPSIIHTQRMSTINNNQPPTFSPHPPSSPAPLLSFVVESLAALLASVISDFVVGLIAANSRKAALPSR